MCRTCVHEKHLLIMWCNQSEKTMSKTIYPNSATRKMYGQVGRKAAAQAKRYNEIFEREKTKNAKEVSLLKHKVQRYEKLPWYKKLWLAIKQLFGKNEPIITDSL